MAGKRMSSGSYVCTPNSIEAETLVLTWCGAIARSDRRRYPISAVSRGGFHFRDGRVIRRRNHLATER